MEDVALDPDKRGDNHSRHMSIVLDYRQVDKRLYHVPTQIWNNKTAKPMKGEILLWPPHEMMAEVKETSPKTLRTGSQDPSTWDFPSFTTHMVTTAYGVEDTFPITVYADCTPFRANDVDSFYAVYIQIAAYTRVKLLFEARLHTTCCCTRRSSISDR